MQISDYIPNAKTPIKQSKNLAVAGLLTAVVGAVALKQFGPLRGFANTAAKVGIGVAGTISAVEAGVAVSKWINSLASGCGSDRKL